MIVFILSLWGVLLTFPNLSQADMAGTPGPEIEIQTGASSVVVRVVFSPDGQLLASGSVDGMLTIWQVPDGLVINRLLGNKVRTPYWDLAFSRDGRLLACITSDWGKPLILHVWRVSDWKLVGTSTVTQTAQFEALEYAKGRRPEEEKDNDRENLCQSWLAFGSEGKFLAIGNGQSQPYRVWSISDRGIVKYKPALGFTGPFPQIGASFSVLMVIWRQWTAARTVTK